MSHVLDKIIDEVRSLSLDEKRHLYEMLNNEVHIFEQARRDVLIKRIRGKYAHLPTSSEAFAAHKIEEITLENRRSQS